MNEHYFSQSPQSKSSPKTWESKLNNKVYQFTSDIGVFSKDSIDFGTKLLIESFVDPAVKGTLLDLGCGYGPIGISLSGKRETIMVDINERAIELARANVEKNDVKAAKVIQSDGFAEIKDKRFAVILTNPPIRAGKQKVYRLFNDAHRQLVHNGELWIVIQKKQGAPSAKKELERLFSNVETVNRKKGFHILKAVKA